VISTQFICGPGGLMFNIFKARGNLGLSFRNSLVVLVLLFPLLVISTANAQTDAEIVKENEELKKQAEEIKSREKEAQGQVSEQTQTVSGLSEDLKILDQEVNMISSRVSTAQAKMNSAQRQINMINNEATEKEKTIRALQKKIGNKAIAGFQIGEVRDTSSSDLTRNAKMEDLLRSITETQIEDIDRLDDLVVSLNEEKALAELLKKEIEESKKILEEDQAKLEIAKQAQEKAVNEAELVLEARLGEVAVLEERDSELASKIQANTSELAARAARRRSPSSNNSNLGTVTSGDIVRVEGIWVHKSIETQFRQLMNDAKADGIDLGGWGYRDSAKQIELRKKHCGTSNYAIYEMSSSRCNPPTARPGASQHEKGLAIDFTYRGGTIGGTAGFRWLKANAAKYGFYNYPVEPWHWSTTGN